MYCSLHQAKIEAQFQIVDQDHPVQLHALRVEVFN